MEKLMASAIAVSLFNNLLQATLLYCTPPARESSTPQQHLRCIVWIFKH